MPCLLQVAVQFDTNAESHFLRGSFCIKVCLTDVFVVLVIDLAWHLDHFVCLKCLEHFERRQAPVVLREEVAIVFQDNNQWRNFRGNEPTRQEVMHHAVD